MSAVNVGNLLLLALAFGITREFTIEKTFMSSVNAGNLLLLSSVFLIIREFTLEKGLLSAVNVGNLNSRSGLFGYQRVHTGEGASRMQLMRRALALELG